MLHPSTKIDHAADIDLLLNHPAQLLSRLIQIEDEKQCLVFIRSLLQSIGFEVFFIESNNIVNLYAKLESSVREDEPRSNVRTKKTNHIANICFAGHVDVVPTGEAAKWIHHPFSGEIDHGCVYGRGAADMKGGIAAFMSALSQCLKQKRSHGELGIDYKVSIMLTGDEEKDGYGARAVLQYLEETGEKIDFCLIGEPTMRQVTPSQKSSSSFRNNHTSYNAKIGARGSLNLKLTVEGQMGHVAYHAHANVTHVMTKIMSDLIALHIDKETPDAFADTTLVNQYFDHSSLQITSIDVGNHATNIVPARIATCINIRYNPHIHNEHTLKNIISNIATKHSTLNSCSFELTTSSHSAGYFSEPERFHYLFTEIVKKHTGTEPQLTTYGGTSDGRFFSKNFPVLEFGLESEMAHTTNERTSIENLDKLCAIYKDFLLQL